MRAAAPRGAAIALALFALAAITGCAGPQRGGGGDSAAAEPARADDREVVRVLRGKATYYADKFQGRKTASGERFNQRAMTAAHRRLPFGTRVRVTNLNNDKTVVVRINDRGPFGGGGRIIDLSRAAAKRLEMIADGIVPVKVEVLAD